MSRTGQYWGLGLLCLIGILVQPSATYSQTAAPMAQVATVAASAARDGSHDFDFNLGTWKTHIKRLRNPLSGSTTWVEFDGIAVTRKVWDGRAQLEELEADDPLGHIQGLALRLYNPQTRQWNLSWASSRDGTIAQPSYGEFKNGRGEFYDQETYKGRMILVREIWSDITADSCHFEQAFSADGGKTWEPNWVSTWTRVKTS